MRILVLICSCRAYPHKRNAVRDTWLQKLDEHMPHFFYVGRGEGALEPDVVELDCGDTYEDLPPKSREAYRYACEHYQFNWAIKVDDDTFLAPERLPGLIALGSQHSEYIGSTAEAHNLYATGGAGIILSRRLCELIASQPVPASNPVNQDGEDGWIGLKLRDAKNRLWSSARLQHHRPLHPQKDNDVVTGHWITPEEMRKFYKALYA